MRGPFLHSGANSFASLCIHFVHGGGEGGGGGGGGGASIISKMEVRFATLKAGSKLHALLMIPTNTSTHEGALSGFFGVTQDPLMMLLVLAKRASIIGTFEGVFLLLQA